MSKATGPIYVASSWRNEHYPSVVEALRQRDIDCYDFRNPTEGGYGFSWRDCGDLVGDDYRHGDQFAPPHLLEILRHPVSLRGFAFDWGAMQRARACVLVMPCGRSAHIEAGFFVGAGRPLHIYLPEPAEPELMWRMAQESGGGIYTTLPGLVRSLRRTAA